jgi:N4-gp56 family major capsid protein
MATIYGDITTTQAAYSAKTLLERAIPYLILEQIGNMKPLPANNTKTIDFRRHKLPVPTSAAGFVLTEGTTPSDQVAEMESYSLTLQQYGAVLSLSDVVMETHIDDVLSEYMGILGEHAGQTMELMRWEELRTSAGVNTLLTNSVSTEADIATAFGKSEIRRAIRSIRANHGNPIARMVKSDARYGTQAVEPSFVAICHTDLEGTIREQLGASFTPVADYGSGATVMKGEFGNFENVRFLSSSLLGKRANAGGLAATHTTLLSDGGTNVNLYDVLVFGADAWCGVALKGEFAVHPSMVRAIPSDSDPLAQRAKCGYKTMQGAKVTQPAHIKKIVSGSLKAY